ncbi:MAG TPA: sigma 54-interacting transcriptional regulator, partial [Polyangiaceae bacterium]|nr:sigma 54-interacting transcriptional regulator [Polyangiaceae bacterium]
REGPFVPVNCGAVPSELFESELFGHARGAFTGASADHVGFFQASDGGTLLLDEISELSPKLQVKLLRVVQDRRVYMLGATKPRGVDVRILAATSRDLRAMVDAGTFREDLYYRVSVVVVHVPPLRVRGNDIELLIRHFAERFAADQNRTPLKFNRAVLAALRTYDWPGNVRELQNLVQRLTVMVEGSDVRIVDLPQHMRLRPPMSKTPSSGLRQVELAHIRSVLDSVGGNKTQAAKILGIDRKTLRGKLKG